MKKGIARAESANRHPPVRLTVFFSEDNPIFSDLWAKVLTVQVRKDTPNSYAKVQNLLGMGKVVPIRRVDDYYEISFQVNPAKLYTQISIPLSSWKNRHFDITFNLKRGQFLDKVTSEKVGCYSFLAKELSSPKCL